MFLNLSFFFFSFFIVSGGLALNEVPLPPLRRYAPRVLPPIPVPYLSQSILHLPPAVTFTLPTAPTSPVDSDHNASNYDNVLWGNPPTHRHTLTQKDTDLHPER